MWKMVLHSNMKTKKPIQKWHRITVEANDWEDVSKHMHKSKALMNNFTVYDLEPKEVSDTGCHDDRDLGVPGGIITYAKGCPHYDPTKDTGCCDAQIFGKDNHTIDCEVSDTGCVCDEKKEVICMYHGEPKSFAPTKTSWEERLENEFNWPLIFGNSGTALNAMKKFISQLLTTQREEIKREVEGIKNKGKYLGNSDRGWNRAIDKVLELLSKE